LCGLGHAGLPMGPKETGPACVVANSGNKITDAITGEVRLVRSEMGVRMGKLFAMTQ
jgi:hypothetical protein